MLDLAIANWWGRLSQEEQDILITLLHKLDLEEYIEVAEDGTYTKLKF